MFKFRLLQLPLLLLASISQGRAQFAHTDHKQIVDAAGKPLILRATNLGNWLVPEGYMWLFEGGPQSPAEIRALVLELLGLEGSDAFWRKYRENYVTREDIAFLHRGHHDADRWATLTLADDRTPTSLTYDDHDPAQGDIDYRFEWSDWRDVGGIRLPYKIRRLIDGRPIREERLSRVTLIEPVSDEKFRIPAIVRAQDESGRRIVTGWTQLRRAMGLPYDGMKTKEFRSELARAGFPG